MRAPGRQTGSARIHPLARRDGADDATAAVPANAGSWTRTSTILVGPAESTRVSAAARPPRPARVPARSSSTDVPIGTPGPVGSGSRRTLTGDGGAVELAAVAVVVVERLMKTQAIVPHDEHPDLPAQAAGEGGLRDVLDEELQ